MQGDRRNHHPAIGVAADHGRRSPARSEHTFETTFVQAACDAKVLDHPDDPAADRNVTHQFGRPGIDLFVALVGQPGTVFTRIGR
jgi:hypothetical protein